MKNEFLKMAGVTSEADFYKKYPTEDAFFNAFPQAKQMAMGGMIDKNVMMQNQYGKGGQMIKRKDGSYSRRGLWDNIRANRGSGKKPTKEMLKQERKIKAKEKAMGGEMYAQGGSFDNPGFKALPEDVQMKIMANTNAYGGQMYAQGGSFNNAGFQALPPEVQAKIKSGAKAYGGNMYAMGGMLPYSFEMGGELLQSIDNGGTHEMNPNGGVPATPDGMNLVEEGETVFDGNFVFSNRLKVTPEVAREFSLGKKAIGKSYAEVSKMYQDEERPNDRFNNRAAARQLENLAEAQESYKAVEQQQYDQEVQGAQEALAMQQMQEQMAQQMAQPMGQEQMMQQQMMQQMPQQMAYGGVMKYQEGGNMRQGPISMGYTIDTENNLYPDDPLWNAWAELGSKINNYSIGAKGTGNFTMYQGVFPLPTRESSIDCSGAVCTIVNNLTGEKVYDLTSTNSTKIAEGLKNKKTIDFNNPDYIDNLNHGSVIYMNNTGNGYNHIAMVLEAPTGEKYLAESSGAYNEVTISPIAERLQAINDSGNYEMLSGDSMLDLSPQEVVSQVISPLTDPTIPTGQYISDETGETVTPKSPEQIELERQQNTLPPPQGINPMVMTQGNVAGTSGRLSEEQQAQMQNAMAAYAGAQGSNITPTEEPVFDLTRGKQRTFLDQASNAMRAPVTAFGYAVRGEDIPMGLENLPITEQNPLEIPVQGLVGAIAAPSFGSSAMGLVDDIYSLYSNARRAYNQRRPVEPGTGLRRTNEVAPPRPDRLGPADRPKVFETPSPYNFNNNLGVPTKTQVIAIEDNPPRLSTEAPFVDPGAPFPLNYSNPTPRPADPNIADVIDEYDKTLINNQTRPQAEVVDLPGYIPPVTMAPSVLPTRPPLPETPFRQTSATASNKTGNYGEFLQYAPAVASGIGMVQAMLDRPDYINPAMTNVDFTPQYLDMTQARANAMSAARMGQRGAASASRGSVGSLMDAQERIAGATAGSLGQTAMQQDLYNRQLQQQSRQQQLAQANANAQRQMQADDFNAASDAARTDRILQMMMGVGENLGEIGTRALYGNQAILTTGYNTRGEKINNNDNTSNNGG